MSNRLQARWWMIWMGAAALGVAAAQTQAQNTVFLTSGKSLQAQSITWVESAQEYRIQTPGGVQIPVPRNQVDHLEIDKPADFDKAAQMIAAKQFDAAMPLLNGIITKYKMLVWDNKGRELLAQAQFGKNDFKKAIGTLEELIESAGRAQVSPDTQVLYWNALLAADRTATLKKELDEVVATGSRDMAGMAQIMRGNINRTAGQKEAALLDYLRTVILFEQVKSVQPEALFRAAEMLDELRDRRADELKKRLLQQYPDSEYAAKFGGK